jgi:tetratricopeptide (TPR) repeat protein
MRLNAKLVEREVFARELLLKLRDDLGEMGFDYLLVDSRTGHTDILGATTVLLPHLVVLLTNLSAQSLKGTRSVLDWIEVASDAAIGKRRPEIGAGENRFFLRSVHDPAIQTIIVASPVPLGDYSALAKAERYKGNLKRAFDHVIYYVPRMAAHETQHVAKSSDEDPVSQYKRLAEKIKELNPFEPGTLVEYGMQSLERQDWTRALSYFAAAQHFLPNNRDDELGDSDRQLNLRRQYGEVRALALGFQTSRALELLSKVESHGVPDGLEEESLAANMQLVRGLLASNELSKALGPAKDAVKCAMALGERGLNGHGWEVLARLQLGDVHYFLGEMEEAEQAVKNVPKQAIVLNRAMERVKAYQLLATSQALTGRFREAEDCLMEATTLANSLGVNYLIAGCAFVRAVIDLTNGRLESGSIDGLRLAIKSYEDGGDGLSTADCLTELAIYRHRIGLEDNSANHEYLAHAWELYKEIAGAKLGQLNVLVYAAEILADRGQLIRAGGGNDQGRAEGMNSASSALKIALGIASDSGLPRDIKEDVAVWASLMNWFLDDAHQIDVSEVGSAVTALNRDWNPDPRRMLRSRNLAFRELLRDQEDLRNFDNLKRIAEQAGDYRFCFNEAVTRTLVALSCVLLNKTECLELQIDRIEHLVKSGRLGWSIWGHVHNVQNHLQTDRAGEWRQAACTLLERATERSILKQPACWLKESDAVTT